MLTVLFDNKPHRILRSERIFVSLVLAYFAIHCFGRLGLSSCSGSGKDTSSSSATNEAALREDSKVGFDWTDVDFANGGDCGITKCFFGSISNASVGYLIASEEEQEQDDDDNDDDDDDDDDDENESLYNYKAMRKASDLAFELATRFGAKHFYLEPPVSLRVSNATVTRLVAAVDQPLRCLANRTQTRVYHSTLVAVQKVIRAPQPTLMYGCCAGTKPQAIRRQLPAFRRLITDKAAFQETLKADRERVSEALKWHPLLYYDFQGMIDLHGNFWFIDLDGHVGADHIPKGRRKIYIRRRLQFLDEVIRNLTKQEQ